MIEDKDYSEYMDYVEKKLNECLPKIKLAVGKRQASYTGKKLQEFYTHDRMNAVGLDNWKPYIDGVMQAYMLSLLVAQCRYSSNAYKAKMTLPVVLEKCRILELSESATNEVLDEYGFGEKHYSAT